MKNIYIFAILMVILSSCAVTTTTLVGNITTLSSDGTPIKTWENVTLSKETQFLSETESTNAMKTFGINFYDEEANKFVILSHAVPCVIEYVVDSKVDNNPFKKDNPKPSDEEIAEELTTDYFIYDEKIKANKRQMKGLPTDSKEFLYLEKENAQYQERMDALNEKHKALVNREITKYYNGY